MLKIADHTFSSRLFTGTGKFARPELMAAAHAWARQQEQLTAFERALLEQFETLARASETALDGSEKTSEALRELSSSVRVRLDQIERKQREIEAINRKLIELLNRQIAALNGQSDVTESLAKQVNALRSERR